MQKGLSSRTYKWHATSLCLLAVAGSPAIAADLAVAEKRCVALLDEGFLNAAAIKPAFDPHQKMTLVLEALRQQNPRRQTGTIKPQTKTRADQALQNKFPAFGKIFDLGSDIHWDVDPTGNIEFVYSLNRHEMVSALANAYGATGDERYAKKAIDLMEDWVRKVPSSKKDPWRPLDLALRINNWAVVLPVLIHSPSMGPADLAILLSSLQEQADSLLPAARWSGDTNHGINEAWALMHVGLLSPALKASRPWSQIGWDRTQATMKSLVLDDGAENELTVGYHAWCLNHFADAYDWAEKNKLTIPAHYGQKLEKMYEYLMFLAMPDGSEPVLGDSDMSDARSFMLDGARRFGRQDMLYVGTSGKKGERPAKLDTPLPNSGYYALRSDWVDPQAVYCMLDVAHLWGGWHSHYDALELHLYGFGRNLFPESGTISYVKDPHERSKATNAHSTIVIDGANQSEAPAVTNAFARDGQVSFVDGSQPGYPGITHRRQVVFVRAANGMPAYFVVVDRVTGSGSHRLEQYFHLPPGEATFDSAARSIRTASTDSGNVLIRSLSPSDQVKVEKVTTWKTLPNVVQSGETMDRPAYRASYNGPLPAVLVTLILPYAGATPPALTATLGDKPSAPGVVSLRVGLRDVSDQITVAADLTPLPTTGPASSLVTVERTAAGKVQWLAAPSKPD